MGVQKDRLTPGGPTSERITPGKILSELAEITTAVRFWPKFLENHTAPNLQKFGKAVAALSMICLPRKTKKMVWWLDLQHSGDPEGTEGSMDSSCAKKHRQKNIAKRLWVSLKDTWTGVLFARTGRQSKKDQ